LYSLFFSFLFSLFSNLLFSSLSFSFLLFSACSLFISTTYIHKPDEIFAQVLLLIDGYLELKGSLESEEERRAERFLMMTKELPLELIMVLVNRVYLSAGTLILSDQTEAALKRVLRYPFL